jgi:hypothetical protein
MMVKIDVITTFSHGALSSCLLRQKFERGKGEERLVYDVKSLKSRVRK